MNDDVRRFLEKLAYGIEPLNSIVGYRNKEDRRHFARKLRLEAEALLKEGEAP